MKRSYPIFTACAVTAGYLFMIVMNSLANILPINGVTTGQISDAIPNLFVPAGITFSIWGVIYIALLVFTIFSVRSLFGKNSEAADLSARVGPFFFLSSIVNGTWIIAWHYRAIGISLALMIALLILLIIIYRTINRAATDSPYKGYRFLSIPISIYFGWISVAMIANVTAFLVDLGWRGGPIGEPVWTVIMISIAVYLTLRMLMTFQDIAFSLVIIWALSGIAIKRSATSLAGAEPVFFGALSGAVFLLLAAGLTAKNIVTFRKK